MVTVKLQKKNDDWIIVVPNDEVERLGLDEGQSLNLQIAPTMDDAERKKRIKEIMDVAVVEYREALEYLAK